MPAATRISLIAAGTALAALLAAHGAWLVLITLAAALDETEEPA